MSKNYDSVVLNDDETFEILIIKRGEIDHLDWHDDNYVAKLMNLDMVESITVTKNNFNEILAINLEIEKFNKPNLQIKNEIFGEEKNYVYQLFYVNLENYDEFHIPENLNKLASIICLTKINIYSHVILFKNYIPDDNESCNMESITRKDIERIVYNRVHTKIVSYDSLNIDSDDEQWKEEANSYEIEKIAEKFFENEYYKKIEISFLLHNIVILYTEDSGKSRECGKLIDKSIEKCLWYSMRNSDYRGNLSLDEVKKIISLSNILDDYKVPEEYTKNKTDEFGRKIVYNKYRVLTLLYNKLCLEK